MTLMLFFLLLELATFPLAVQLYGIGGEQNPLAVGVFATLGIWGVMAMKGAQIVVYLRLSTLKVISKYRPMMMTIGAVIGGLGALSQIAVIAWKLYG